MFKIIFIRKEKHMNNEYSINMYLIIIVFIINLPTALLFKQKSNTFNNYYSLSYPYLTSYISV